MSKAVTIAVANSINNNVTIHALGIKTAKVIKCTWLYLFDVILVKLRLNKR